MYSYPREKLSLFPIHFFTKYGIYCPLHVLLRVPTNFVLTCFTSEVTCISCTVVTFARLQS